MGRLAPFSRLSGWVVLPLGLSSICTYRAALSRR